MASRDDQDRERHPPSRWEGEAPRASQTAGAEPWRRESAHARGDPGPRGFTGDEGREPAGPHTGGWGSWQGAGLGAPAGPGAPGGSYGAAAYGSGRWGGQGQDAPSGYSGPSGTGYGQTCQGQSGYGQGGQGEPGSPGHGAGVSYAGTAGYAGYEGYAGYPGDPAYAGERQAESPNPWPPGDARRPRPDWHDIDYQQWRDEQLRKLDADYLTWREARYRKFADEFNAWRSSRQDAAGAARADSSVPAASMQARSTPPPGGDEASNADEDGAKPASTPSSPSSFQPK